MRNTKSRFSLGLLVIVLLAVPGWCEYDVVGSAKLHAALLQDSAVRLSAGVALPQTGPTGRLMSFSIDYQFTRGGPTPEVRYVWVIERTKGKPAAQLVRLNDKGTLRTFIPGWRPEEGPFQTYVEELSKDGSRRKISRAVSLR